tara:strand:+ start:431 stop:1468 length:1038 start_codon:yes stop_codon:yes gene_type:complete
MNVLFFGLGGIGQRYLRLVKKNFSNFAVYAYRIKGRKFEITDKLNANQKIDIEKKYNIKRIKNLNYLNKIKIDFAIICNPTSEHIKTIKKLLKHKIPILVEKPLSNSINRLDDVLLTLKKNKTLLLTGHMMRFNPAVIKLKKMIKNNFLGRIYNVVIKSHSYMPGWHKYEDFKKLYASNKSLGGGVILTETHEIDLLKWIFGIPNKIIAFKNKKNKFNLDVEDTVNGAIKYNNRFNFLVTFSLSFIQKLPTKKISIYGKKGKLTLDLISNKLTFENIKNTKPIKIIDSNISRNELFYLQLKHFVSLIKKKRTTSQILDNGYDSLKICLAIKKSIIQRDVNKIKVV